MKRFVYMIVLCLLALLASALFSLFGVDRFLFYTFFFFISAFMCGLKPMPVLILFLIADGFIADGIWLYNIQLFFFVLATCIAYRKTKVYPAAAFGYVICLAAGALWQIIVKENVLMIFDKWIFYLIAVMVALPFVFALMRAGIVNRKRG